MVFNPWPGPLDALCRSATGSTGIWSKHVAVIQILWTWCCRNADLLFTSGTVATSMISLAWYHDSDMNYIIDSSKIIGLVGNGVALTYCDNRISTNLMATASCQHHVYMLYWITVPKSNVEPESPSSVEECCSILNFLFDRSRLCDEFQVMVQLATPNHVGMHRGSRGLVRENGS